MRLSNPTYSCACLLIAFVFFAVGCSESSDTGEVEVIFTANGAVLTNVGTANIEHVVIQGKGGEITANTQRRMNAVGLEFEWEPGEEYTFLHGNISVAAMAPQRPALALIGTVPFDEGLLTLKADQRDRGASAMAISPGAKYAAIGTDDGGVILISLVAGKIVDQRKKPGSYIRSLVFIDDERLVVGEQAPKGSIILYKIGNGHLREDWRFNSSEIVGHGEYDESDPFSWVRQPGIYRFLAGKDNSLYAIATHSRFVEGERNARWAALKLSQDSGAVQWFYSTENAGGVATWFDIDDAEKTLAICIGKDTGEGALLLLNAENGKSRAEVGIAPLAPHLSRVNFWRGVSISPGGGTVYAISDDGRAFAWNGKASVQTIELGKPILADDFPILISGVGVVSGDPGAYFITGTTFIPWELSSGEVVPQPHPAANTVFYLRQGNSLSWGAPVPNLSQGFAMTKDANWLLVSYTSNPMFSSGKGAGLSAIRIKDAGGEPLATFSLAGNVAIGSPVIDASDRFIILVENGRRSSDGESIEGRNALHLLFW